MTKLAKQLTSGPEGKKTYQYTFIENGRRYPLANVTPLGNGKALYEDFISLVEVIMPVDEAFSKAIDKKSRLMQRF